MRGATRDQAATIADRYIGRDGGIAVANEVVAPASADAVVGHNGAPEPTPYEAISKEVDDLYLEAKNWADGEPIANEQQHEEVTRLYDLLHDAGKRADEARVAEKKPLDEKVKELQDRWNLLIGNTKTAKGRVTLGKEVLGTMLAPWRTKVADAKAEAARIAREEADKRLAEAQAAIRASACNLEDREQAEIDLKEAKREDRFAKRADREATTGTGLRAVWTAEMKDEGMALDWAYGRDPVRFRSLVQSMAEEAVRGGLRAIPGFDVREEKVAR